MTWKNFKWYTEISTFGGHQTFYTRFGGHQTIFIHVFGEIGILWPLYGLWKWLINLGVDWDAAFGR